MATNGTSSSATSGPADMDHIVGLLKQIEKSQGELLEAVKSSSSASVPVSATSVSPSALSPPIGIAGSTAEPPTEETALATSPSLSSNSKSTFTSRIVLT